MYKILIGSISLIILCFVFYSYYNGPQSDGPLEGSDHAQILLQSGDKLGVDLTSPLFADQTKCYADPFELYTDPAVKFRSICYKNGPVITDIFWVRNDISLQSFVEQNVDVIARQRARDGSLNTDQKIINVIESKDDVVYHSIQIGDDFYAVQGTFFVVTKQASDMEVNLAVVVKAVNLESAKQRIEEIKSLSLQKNQVSKIHVPFNFIHRAHAGAGGDGGPGGNGGGSSSSPGLTDGSGSAVVDGSGNAVGTGAASTGTNGNDGSGAAGTGTSVTPAVTALFTATPGTINPNDSANLTWTVTGATSCIAGGGWSGAQTATNGTHSFAVSPESTTSYTLTCTGPGGSVGPLTTTVTVNPPILNFVATPSLIGPGSSTLLSWTTIGATTCTGSGGTGWLGNKAVNDSESKEPTVTTIYNLSCSGPSGTTSKSVTVSLPSGSINATSCEIPASAASCASNVSWNSVNLLGTPSVLQQGVQFSTAASSGGTPRAATPTANTFTLRDTGSTFEREVVASVNCHMSSVWVAPLSICLLLPQINIIADPNIVRSGETAPIEITVTANYALTCTVTGGLVETITHSASASPQTYNFTTNPLTAAQIVTINCISPLYANVFGSDEVRVSVIPTIQEI